MSQPVVTVPLDSATRALGLVAGIHVTSRARCLVSRSFRRARGGSIPAVFDPAERVASAGPGGMHRWPEPRIHAHQVLIPAREHGPARATRTIITEALG